MSVPGNFLTRLVIPLIASSLLFDTDIGRKQVETYDRVLKLGDQVLSATQGQGIESFDYIVVGGGSAGAVVANRLSASGVHSVLLIEAGGDPNPISDVPILRRHIWEQSTLVKSYAGVPQKNACLAAGSCFHPRAIALGGCSVLNYAVYNRCNRNDYDSWARFTNDPTWSWDNVEEAFKQIEDYHGIYKNSPGVAHRQGGEVHIGIMDYMPGVDFLLKAFAQEGIPVGGDLNSGHFPYGYSIVDSNLKKGFRQSSFNAFLQPIIGVRKNLVIYRYAWATKIRIDQRTHKAVGVEYKRHGRFGYAEARREVIVSAGAYESPKLLMLSGIGPKDHLDQMGIQTVVDLPAVGNFLQDHIASDGHSHPFAINVTWDTPDFFTNETLHQFLSTGTGPLNSFEWGDKFAPQLAMGYVTSRRGDLNWPDIQTYVHEEPVRVTGNKIQQTIFIDHALMRPQSSGTIRLASRNPEDNPVIDPKFFEQGDDLERLIDGVEFTSNLMLSSRLFQSVGVKWSDDINIPTPCRPFIFASRDYWRCVLRQTSFTHYHPTSTCRMGPNRNVAVLDSKLRVYGTTGLRVIDASSMPFVPSGNTNFPAMMLGHVGAGLVLLRQVFV